MNNLLFVNFRLKGTRTPLYMYSSQMAINSIVMSHMRTGPLMESTKGFFVNSNNTIAGIALKN